METVAAKYGDGGAKRYASLLRVMEEAAPLPEKEKLNRINNFYNQVPYQSDRSCWSAPDHWSTPYEMLGIGEADCEDYAIAKFFTLIQMGVPQEKLFLTYAVTDNGTTRHMVLAYYEHERSIPLILDNRALRIDEEKISKEYIPLYRFNLQHVITYDQGFGKKSPINFNKMAKWESVTKRFQERF